jgi:branched-chain amino acid transport system permease protein
VEPTATAYNLSFEPALARGRTLRWVPLAGCSALLLLLPVLAGGLGSGSLIVQIALLALVYAVIAQCWNLVIGFSGIFSVAQLTLFGIGGYAAGASAIHLGWSPWTGILLGGIAAALTSLVIGLPMLRLTGVYVALLTLAFNELVRNFVTTGPEALGRASGMTVPQLFSGPSAVTLTYYVGLVIFGLTTWAVWRVVRSPIGMGFQALRDAEPYAVGRGIARLRMRLFLFAYSAFFTGVAGGFYVAWQGVVSPSMFDTQLLFTLLMAMVLGGWATLVGPILGVAFLIVLTEGILRTQDPILQQLVYGVIVVAVVVKAPRGLVGLCGAIGKRISGYFAQFD